MGDDTARSESEDGDSKPSLKGLAQRVAQRRDAATPRPDAQNDEPVASNSTAPEASEFVYPADEETTRGAEFGVDAKTDALVELVGNTPNLLLLGPVSCPADYDLCSGLVRAADDELTNLLLVTYESPDTRLDVLEGHLGGLPDNVVVLGVGGSARSRSESAGPDRVRSGETITVETISDPSNIQRLGITISQHVAEWASADGDTLVCFHSLSSLLGAIEDTQRVFRFLNTLFGRVQSANAYAHYHMDPDAHDQETISTFRPMFDEIVTFDEDGSLRIDRQS